MPKWNRNGQTPVFAPDGAEIRNLIHREQGATRLSLAEALVPAGQRTAKVYHQTTYEEIWYFLQGSGVFHLHEPGTEAEDILAVAPGDTILIRPGYGFWVENTGTSDLTFLCCGSPPWPGDQEAQRWPPRHD